MSINGAELLTDIRYIDTLKELKQVSFISNGLEIGKPEVLKKLKDANIECVAMSMHYGIHDELSVIPQRTIEENIRILKENNIESKIFVTITKKNYLKIPEICEYVKSLDVHKIWFTNYIKQGSATRLSDNNILDKEAKKQFFKL